ncbi:MAG: hypothetical protein MUE94_08390 [Verrucomicrobia bacterium]|nr:hypothetical protein [Verrucomicrobiota bacterium]
MSEGDHYGLSNFLADAQEYKSIAPWPQREADLFQMAKGRRLHGEKGSNGHQGRAPQMVMRVDRCLRGEALKKYEEWKRNPDALTKQGFFEIPGKEIAQRQRMPLESVYRAVKELEKVGKVDIQYNGFRKPYLIRYRFDRANTLCWKVRKCRQMIRCPRSRKPEKRLHRSDKPWPNKMKRLLLSRNGNRRRLPICDIVRVINGQLLPGEPETDGNNTRVADQMVEVIKMFVNQLYRRASAGLSFNGELPFKDMKEIGAKSGLRKVKSAYRVISILEAKNVCKKFRRNGQFGVVLNVNKLLKIESQIGQRTGQKKIPVGRDYIINSQVRCAPGAAAVAGFSPSDKMGQSLALGRFAPLGNRFPFLSDEESSVTRLLQQRFEFPVAPADRVKLQRLINSRVKHRRFPMTARMLQEVFAGVDFSDGSFGRYQVKHAQDLREFLNRWPGYYCTLARYQDDDLSQLRVRSELEPDRFLHICPEDIVGGSGLRGEVNVVEYTLKYYDHLGHDVVDTEFLDNRSHWKVDGLLARHRATPEYREAANDANYRSLLMELRRQCLPPGHWETQNNSGRWTRLPEHKTRDWNPFMPPACPVPIRFIAETQDSNDNGIKMLCVAFLLGMQQRFATLARRHLPVLLMEPLIYYSCYKQWGRDWLKASGVGDEDHIKVMRKAKCILDRAYGWRAIMSVHERVEARAKALAARNPDPEAEIALSE